MNTLDLPTSYVPALEEQDAVGKDMAMDTLPVDLMDLIDDCTTEWANDDGEDLLAALGGESFEEALEREGVTLLDASCGLIGEDVLDFVTEEVAAEPIAEAEADCQPAEVADDQLFPDPVLSPFSQSSLNTANNPACHPSRDVWIKFDFPEEEIEAMGLSEYCRSFDSNEMHLIDWEKEMNYFDPLEEKLRGRTPSVMWNSEPRQWTGYYSEYDPACRPKPMPTAAELRRKLMEEDSFRGSRPAVAVTPDNSLPLANRSTTVPAASALKSRPMRSLLNTKQQQHVVKTNSRSLLLPTARAKVQHGAPPAGSKRIVVKQIKPAPTMTTCYRVPPAEKSIEIKASRSPRSEDEAVTPNRPETPQSLSESEDEAPVFRHNTIDTILSSTLCDASASSVYLTPSDSSGSPKSAIGDEDDDDEDDVEEEEEEEEEEEDEEEEEQEYYEHENLRSPPESVIREERPARTVLPYISDHSYHLSKSNMRMDGLGVQTPSDSEEEEIDVVSVGADKGTARLPNNPSARDRRQIQEKVATAIHRQGRTDAGDASSGSRKRQAPAAAAAGRGGVKRGRAAASPQVPGRALGLGMGKGKAFGAGRGRRRANAEDEPDPCEKRSMHNSMERQRRIDLRNQVELLRNVVPATAGNRRAAKVVILREAANYCRELTAISEGQELELHDLQTAQKSLQRTLSSLRTELAAQRMKHQPPVSYFSDEEDYFAARVIKPCPEEEDSRRFRDYGDF